MWTSSGAVLARRLARLEARTFEPDPGFAAYRSDPVGLARAVGLEPDDWQCRLLQSTAAQMILNCSRQSGKSQITAIKALHRAMYQPGALILVLSPSERQSKETFRKIRDAYTRLGKSALPALEESTLSLRLVNGSRLICLPGKEGTVRGFSGVNLLIVDEASRVEDDLYKAIRPMLSVSRGSIILLSSPFGQRGFFWEAWENGQGWERFLVTAHDCPRITEEWLAEERETLGELWFAQEYECRFMDTSTQAFSTELVLAAVSPAVKPLFAEAA